MLHASTKKLIDRLAEMTELAKLDWTEGDDGIITYSTEGYSVSLTEAPNEMVITSKDGKELERASADELAATPGENGTSYADIVAAMTKEASRVARGTEAAISTLLAGMDAPEAEVAPEPAAEEIEATPESDLQEDQGDETEVLTDESVEAVAPEAIESVEAAADEPEEPTEEVTHNVDAEAPVDDAELAREEDIDASDVSEETEDDAAPILTADADDSAPEIEETDAEMSAEEPELDAAPDTRADSETEHDVTEAVVRLADEVNQREESTLDAAAASAVGAVALAAGLSTESEAPDAEEVEAESATESVETESLLVAATAEESTTPEPYVPFGLEQTDEPVAASEMDEQTAVVDSAELETVSADPVATFEADEVVAADAAPTMDAPQEAVTFETQVSEPENTWAPQTQETIASPVTNVAEAATEETAVEAPAPAVDAAPEPVVETPEPQVESEPEAPAPQTYSLSGIGAGFGLGALSAKTEATGVPGPTGAMATEEDKVVIDATEDVLPEIDGKPALPPEVTALTPPGTPESTTPSASDAGETNDEDDILKPRTRFNPWD